MIEVKHEGINFQTGGFAFSRKCITGPQIQRSGRKFEHY